MITVVIISTYNSLQKWKYTLPAFQVKLDTVGQNSKQTWILLTSKWGTADIEGSANANHCIVLANCTLVFSENILHKRQD